MIAKIKFLPQPQNTKSNTFMDQTKVNTFGLNAICNRDRSKPFVFLFSTRGSNKTHFPKMSVLFAFWDPQFYLTTFFFFFIHHCQTMKWFRLEKLWLRKN